MLKPIDIQSLPSLYKQFISKDFPPIERAPLFAIKRNFKKGNQEGYLFIYQNTEVGYTINTITDECIMIALFAIFPEYRFQGLGQAFVREILEKYQDKKAIILEIERPELAEDEADRAIREKRLAFYEKNGFRVYRDIEYVIFGVPMYLMVYSEVQLDKAEVMEMVYRLYREILNKHMMKMVVMR